MTAWPRCEARCGLSQRFGEVQAGLERGSVVAWFITWCAFAGTVIVETTNDNLVRALLPVRRRNDWRRAAKTSPERGRDKHRDQNGQQQDKDQAAHGGLSPFQRGAFEARSSPCRERAARHIMERYPII